MIGGADRRGAAHTTAVDSIFRAKTCLADSTFVLPVDLEMASIATLRCSGLTLVIGGLTVGQALDVLHVDDQRQP